MTDPSRASSTSAQTPYRGVDLTPVNNGARPFVNDPCPDCDGYLAAHTATCPSLAVEPVTTCVKSNGTAIHYWAPPWWSWLTYWWRGWTPRCGAACDCGSTTW